MLRGYGILLGSPQDSAAVWIQRSDHPYLTLFVILDYDSQRKSEDLGVTVDHVSLGLFITYKSSSINTGQQAFHQSPTSYEGYGKQCEGDVLYEGGSLF